MGRDRTVFPLVYSCSGCSSAAQMANHIALELDRADGAEMSCIAVDGCPLECPRNCLARHGVTPDLHVQLSDHGVRKRYHMQFDPDEAAALARDVADDVALLAAERRLLQPV